MKISKRMKKVFKKANIDSQLDILWSKRVKEIGYCEKCGKTYGLQASHIISRTHRNTRWDLQNGLCLCKGCHKFWAHKEPLEFTEWVKEKLGEKEYEALRMRGQIIAKGLDKEAIKLYLLNTTKTP
jgi:5-methylcytosine-specific restriction endonuclease McrA